MDLLWRNLTHASLSFHSFPFIWKEKVSKRVLAWPSGRLVRSLIKRASLWTAISMATLRNETSRSSLTVTMKRKGEPRLIGFHLACYSLPRHALAMESNRGSFLFIHPLQRMLLSLFCWWRASFSFHYDRPAINQQKIAGRSLSFLWSTPRLTLERKKERWV